MNLLHIIGSVDPVSGGPIEGILRQEEVLPQGFRREIASLDLPGSDFLTDFPMTVHPLGVRPRRGVPWRKYGYTSRFKPWLDENLHRFDAVIVNGLWNFSAFAAARALAGGSKPYFVFSHGMMDPWFRSKYPLKHLGKQLSWWLCEGPLINNANAVLFTSEDEMRLARGQFFPYHPNERVVGYGTTDMRGDPEEQKAAFAPFCPKLKGRAFLLYLSRIHEKKGCDLLIAAFAKIALRRADLDLVIAGPDQEGLAQTLKAQAEALGIGERIHWPGMLTGAAKWGAFRSCEAFILPSHQENFGIVVAEAMACGKPALITDKVNIWREVQTSGGGMVESDTSLGIDTLLTRFIDLDPLELEAMGIAARVCFENHFDLAHLAVKLMETLVELRDAGPQRSGQHDHP
jgi:glycosyltransferase involved in cell wall biosynthesis